MAKAEAVHAVRSPAEFRIRHLLVWTLAILCLADVAEARITMRRHSPYDTFFFHGNYSTDPFDPSDGFRLEVWNCATGEMPIFVADREARIVCNTETGVTVGDLAYAVDVPAGACVDHGRSCYYRNNDVPSAGIGVRYFRVQYSHRGRGNRVWLQSYGDLSSATQANMLILIKINEAPRAVRSDTFIPLNDGGWFLP